MTNIIVILSLEYLGYMISFKQGCIISVVGEHYHDHGQGIFQSCQRFIR